MYHTLIIFIFFKYRYENIDRIIFGSFFKRHWMNQIDSLAADDHIMSKLLELKHKQISLANLISEWSWYGLAYI